jgi:hypothetical protein
MRGVSSVGGGAEGEDISEKRGILTDNGERDKSEIVEYMKTSSL